MSSNILYALFLSMLAGLSTGIGSLISFFRISADKRFFSAALGFSAGVMIYVSIAEMFPEARNQLTEHMGMRSGSWATAAAFFAGMILIAVLNRLLPHECGVHNSTDPEKDGRLMRTGVFTAATIAIHNFPEGIATFVSALQSPSVAVPIVAAIAMHNIPEGVAVSVPIYHATGSRKKAFVYSFLSGLAEPAGALLCWLILMPFMNVVVFNVTTAMVAGIMVFISIDQLLPVAREYGEHHLSINGMVTGMITMAISLLLFI